MRGNYPEAVRQNRRGDQLVLRYFDKELVIGGLIKEHHIVDLLLLFTFAPFLQMSAPTTNINYSLAINCPPCKDGQT
jgi:hypothetical protein